MDLIGTSWAMVEGIGFYFNVIRSHERVVALPPGTVWMAPHLLQRPDALFGEVFPDHPT